MTAPNTSSAPVVKPTVTDRLHGKLVAGIEYPTAAVASYIVSPRTLLGVRLVLFTFMLAVGITSLVDWFSITRGFALDLMYFAFFTNCNLWGLIFYLGLALPRLRSFPAPCHSALALVHVELSFHPLVVLVYWLFLSSRFFTTADALERFISASSHGVTFVVVLIEVMLGGMAMNPWAVVPVVLLLCIYTVWAIVYHAIGDRWVYGFLDPTQPAAAYMYPGILIASVIFFGFMMLVHRLRNRVFAGRSLILPTAAVNKSVFEEASAVNK
ncbi:hypothetical protein BCR44DRAFT_1501004 [Catenaria anguillulae PL171]|uniref:FAR-17a/AIG1-like protein n=1 Tax=Catenaria anguillulae PL171 TaxID=765915 RepID=A0A1Y2HGV8_9FUNG|nr:hypothetical protein BCR44DRAFT_1501004 [Catenaria anguillulae PL171]